MQYCPECESVMVKNTTSTGQIIYQCRCQITVPGTAEDTLMYEEYLEDDNSYAKHADFIDNSPYDLASNDVMKDCLQCGLNFLTMIRIGVQETTIYTCDCGYISTHAEYMAAVAASSKDKDKK